MIPPAVICGIDPGVTGAICFLSTTVTVIDLPLAALQFDDADHLDGVDLSNMIRRNRPDVAVVEAAASFPKQGVRSVFRYGQAYGTILGCLEALYIRVVKIAPGTWKRQMGLPAAPAGYAAHKKTAWRKEQAMLLATELYPDDAWRWARKKDNHRAEALLIAHWGRKNYVHLQ